MRKIAMLLATAGTTLVLLSGVALAATVVCDGGVCKGTGGNDTLRGSNVSDTIYGGGGLDKIDGNLGADAIKGSAGADTIRGDYGRDKIYGEAGGDTIDGGVAIDRIVGGPGRDEVDAGNNNDYVNVADGELDSVSCGLGGDTAIVDDADLSRQSFEDFVRLSSCEEVRVHNP